VVAAKQLHLSEAELLKDIRREWEQNDD